MTKEGQTVTPIRKGAVIAGTFVKTTKITEVKGEMLIFAAIFVELDLVVGTDILPMITTMKIGDD